MFDRCLRRGTGGPQQPLERRAFAVLLAPWGVWTRAPLWAACWVPVDGPIPPLGTPTSGGVGPVQTPFEGIKAVPDTG